MRVIGFLTSLSRPCRAPQATFISVHTLHDTKFLVEESLIQDTLISMFWIWIFYMALITWFIQSSFQGSRVYRCQGTSSSVICMGPGHICCRWHGASQSLTFSTLLRLKDSTLEPSKCNIHEINWKRVLRQLSLSPCKRHLIISDMIKLATKNWASILFLILGLTIGSDHLI